MTDDLIRSQRSFLKGAYVRDFILTFSLVLTFSLGNTSAKNYQDRALKL